MSKLSNGKIEEITALLGKENVLLGEPMAEHVSMKVGGPADYFFTPKDTDGLAYLIRTLKEAEVPFYVLGNGTNVIVKDRGYRGAIINLLDNWAYAKIPADEEAGRVKVKAGAGMKLKNMAEKLCEAGLKGFEFASGIPGSIGGATTMNAGAYDGEMKQIITSVKAMDMDGNVRIFAADECDFGYRHSAFSDGSYIVLETEMALVPGEVSEIRAVIDDLTARREAKQPLEHPSSGSTFKRPEGYFAAKLISDCGLKGIRVGGASVSSKHCGFVVNDKDGTASDVLGVIELVKRRVRLETGVELECEVKIIGE